MKEKKTMMLSVLVMFTMVSAGIVALLPSDDVAAADDDPTVIKEVNVTVTVFLDTDQRATVTVPEGVNYTVTVANNRGCLANNASLGGNLMWANADGTNSLNFQGPIITYTEDFVFSVGLTIKPTTGYTFASDAVLKVNDVVVKDFVTVTNTQITCPYLHSCGVPLYGPNDLKMGVPAYMPEGMTVLDAMDLFYSICGNFDIVSVQYTHNGAMHDADEFEAGEIYGAVVDISAANHGWFKLPTSYVGGMSFIYDFGLGAKFAGVVVQDGDRFNLRITFPNMFVGAEMLSSADVKLNGIPRSLELGSTISDNTVGANSLDYNAVPTWYLKGSSTPLDGDVVIEKGKYVLEVLLTPMEGYGLSESSYTDSKVTSKKVVDGSLLLTYEFNAGEKEDEGMWNTTSIIAVAAVGIVALLSAVYVIFLRK